MGDLPSELTVVVRVALSRRDIAEGSNFSSAIL